MPTPPPEPRRLGVRLSDGEMSVLEFGDAGRPVDVVFAHANGFHALAYRTVLAPLGETLRVWAVDLRGHGRSTLLADPRTHRSWDVYGRDLAVLLQGLEQKRRPVLSGHSMGGTAMVLAAARAPGRARRLVLFDPVFLPRALLLYARLPWSRASAARNPLVRQAAGRRAEFAGRAEALEAYRGRGAFKTWPEASLRDYVEGGFRDRTDGCVELACAPAWEAANFAAHRADPYRALARLEVPTTILKAEHGSTCHADPAWLKRRAQVKTVPGSTHFLPLERPDVVRRFLQDAAESP